MRFPDFSTAFTGWSSFPTDKTGTTTIIGRYRRVFLLLAVPLALLEMAHLVSHASSLIAGWGIFWLGVFRYWVRDLQLDDAVLDRVGKENYLWTVPVFTALAYLVIALCLLALLGGAPALPFLVGYAIFAGAGLGLTVIGKSLRRRRQRLRGEARINQTG